MDKPNLERGRWCYVIVEQFREAEGYVPAIAVEGDPGLYPMLGNGECASPWYWGKTREEAQAIADATNARMGISVERATEITDSSIRASLAR